MSAHAAAVAALRPGTMMPNHLVERTGSGRPAAAMARHDAVCRHRSVQRRPRRTMRSVLVALAFNALLVACARAAEEATIPASGAIASCAVESQALGTGAWKPPPVTCTDVVVFLREAKAVSKDVWLHNYSHVGMADHTGTIILNTGEKIRWLIRPGGLGRLTLQDGTELFLVRCCAK
jgi:hypothetical protein